MPGGSAHLGDPPDGRPEGIDPDGDEIAAGHSEGGCGAAEVCRLSGGELLDGIHAHPGLHLHGRHDAVDHDQEIDLVVPDPEVAGPDPGTTVGEQAGRQPLPEVP